MCILQQTTKVIGKSSITLFLLSQFQKLSAPFCSNIFNSCKQPTLLPQPHSSQRMRRSKPASRHNCSDASIPRFKMGDPSSGGWAQEILRNPIGKSKTIVSRLADDRKKTRSSMLRSVGLLFQGRSCVFSLSRPEKYTSFFRLLLPWWQVGETAWPFRPFLHTSNGLECTFCQCLSRKPSKVLLACTPEVAGYMEVS